MGTEGGTIEVLLTLTSTLGGGVGLDAALEAVTEAALALLPCDRASIRVYSEGGDRLLGAARSGVAPPDDPGGPSAEAALVEWVLAQGSVARVRDVASDPRCRLLGGKPSAEPLSLVAAPLTSSGQVIGVLAVGSKEVGAFVRQDELLAMLLANCAVPAMERARVERLAMTDPYTRAYNRRYLFPRLRQEIRRARRYGLPLSLLLVELDGFAATRADEGDQAAERVLGSLADRIRELVRTTDVLVRRTGDDLLLIMPHTDLEQAFAVAQRIRASVASTPLEPGGRPTRARLSVGVATWNGQEGAKELELRADEAMAEATRRGSDRVVLAQRPRDDG